MTLAPVLPGASCGLRMRTRIRPASPARWRRLLPALLGAVLATPTGAQFLELANLNTRVPGGAYFPSGPGGDTFSALSAPLVSGRDVVFVANTAEFPDPEISGIFRTSILGAPVQELVSRRTWLPEYTGPRSGPTPGPFDSEGFFLGHGFSPMGFQDGRLAFSASVMPTRGQAELRRNVYRMNANGTDLQHVYRAAGSTIGNVAVAANRVVIYDSSPQPTLIQREIGAGGPGSGVIVTTNQPVAPPNTIPIFQLLTADFTAYAEGVEFYAFAGGNSLWRNIDGSDPAQFELLRRGSSTAAQPAPIPILTMQMLSADTKGSLTFRGGSAGDAQIGVFTQRTATDWIRSELQTIATTADVAPGALLVPGTAAPSGSTIRYKNFLQLASTSRVKEVTPVNGPVNRYLETDVVFAATDTGLIAGTNFPTDHMAIYGFVDDQISSAGPAPAARRLIGVGNEIDGKRISHVQISRHAISGNGAAGSHVAFFARFDDGSEGIFSVPLRPALPLGGVNVAVETRGTPPARTTAADVLSARAMLAPAGAGMDAASGEGSQEPATGAMRIAASARGSASSQVQVTGEQLVTGPPNTLVDVSLNFDLSGILGVQQNANASASFYIVAQLFRSGRDPVQFFDGGVRLLADGTVQRLVDYAEAAAAGDLSAINDPFGDGRLAHGVLVQTQRTFANLVQALAGERLAVRYDLVVESDGFALADFSNTLVASAWTDTPGASLATIHLAPIPEPGQLALMVGGLLLLAARLRRSA